MKIENIKFKAKRLDNGEWIIGSFVVMKIPALSKTTIGIVAAGSATLHEVDPSTVCMFTGLKDCVGNEICEGDILEGESKYEIVYTKGAFATVCIGYNERVYSYPLCYFVKEDGAVEGKVVGNKFDEESSV